MSGWLDCFTSERIYFNRLFIDKVRPPVSPAAMADSSWWKLTFSRKKKSEAKVLYEIPPEYNTGNKEHSSNNPPAAHTDSQFNSRLEKIVDKSATKGRHVKVSNSGRYKEKKRIRVTLEPNLFAEKNLGDENHKKKTEK